MIKYCGDCEHRDGWRCRSTGMLLSLETNESFSEGAFRRDEQCPFNEEPELSGYAIPVMSLEDQNTHLREENRRLRALVERGSRITLSSNLRDYVSLVVDCKDEVEKWDKK